MPKKDPFAHPEKRNIGLKNITVHDFYIRNEGLLVDSIYLLKDLKHIRPQAITPLLLMHPVITTERRKNEIVCIGGIRSLSAATQVLAIDAEIPIWHYRKLDDNEVEALCLADVMLTPLALTLGSDGHHYVQSILSIMGDAANSITDLVGGSKVDVAKAFGMSRGCLYGGKSRH